ncbi:MAG: hypothetical protein IT299_06790 [Dehalococcoidia bacterium]|nr:hypothetical protein [Dehalococcoidia bacterium]
MHQLRASRGWLAVASGMLGLLLISCGGSSNGTAEGASTVIRAAGPPPAEETAPPDVTSSVGWDAAPLARDYGFGVPYQLVGLACAKGLPPKATVLVKVAGSAGARPALGVEVGSDGTVIVPFGLLRPGEVIWEFQSITLKDGSGYGKLPPGAAGTAVGGVDEPCRF